MTDIPLPSPGDTSWSDWGADEEAMSDRLRAYSPALEDFRAGTDPDWTNAFAAAATWSATNHVPVFIPPSATEYITAAPVVLAAYAQFFSTVVPVWTGIPAGYTPATVVRPAASGFPNSRGVFEFGTTARGTALRGFAIRGHKVGTSVHGVSFPGLTGSSELGVQLENMDVYDCSGDGVRGGVRMAFINGLYTHENTGYGLNCSDGWNDTVVRDLWCFYNKTGGINIDVAARLNFFQCRVDRSGQPAYVPDDQTDPNWNATAPGIRIRGGGNISFVQCGTDANNGPGVDIQTTSATPPNGQPWGVFFSDCQFVRDGQGGGTATDTASTGIKVRGFAFVGGQDVGHIHFLNCNVTPAPSDDVGGGPVNPNRAVWLENTEFVSWVGGWPNGNTSKFYFGASADPATANYRFNIHLPHLSTVSPTWNDTPAFTTTGQLRSNGATLQYWNGTAWTNV